MLIQTTTWMNLKKVNATCKEPEQKKQCMLYDSIYIKYQKMQTNIIYVDRKQISRKGVVTKGHKETFRLMFTKHEQVHYLIMAMISFYTLFKYVPLIVCQLQLYKAICKTSLELQVRIDSHWHTDGGQQHENTNIKTGKENMYVAQSHI